METAKIFIYYLILINLVAFLAFGLDKRKAKRNAWHVKEATLIGLAIIGGSVGAFLGMKIFHHKTLHKKFTMGIPLILVVQILLGVYIKLCIL